MPKVKITPERVLSNRNHHLTFWKETYSDIQKEYADDVIRLVRIIKRFKERERQMKHIDNIRRENAFNMGVGLAESDELYNFDNERAGIKSFIDESNAQLKQFGLSYASFVKDDEPSL